jgi:hypothetical protein
MDSPTGRHDYKENTDTVHNVLAMIICLEFDATIFHLKTLLKGRIYIDNL